MLIDFVSKFDFTLVYHSYSYFLIKTNVVPLLFYLTLQILKRPKKSICGSGKNSHFLQDLREHPYGNCKKTGGTCNPKVRKMQISLH